MLGRVLKKTFELLITFLFSTVIIFLLIHLAPGDPVETLYGRETEVAVSDKQEFDTKIEEMRTQLGLNESLPVQYMKWLGNLMRFNLGKSICTGRSVSHEIRDRLPTTILLAVTAMIIQIVFGLFFGIISALRAGKAADNIIRFVCVVFSSVPGFVIGLGLLVLFAVNLNIYIIGGDLSFKQLFLPALTLAVGLAPQFIRVVRASMLSEFGQTYILSARARGLSRLLIVKHALKNSEMPIITLLSFSFAALLGGSVIVENIFALPGIGKYAFDGILIHDYPVIQGYAFIMVLLVICVNLIVDIIYVSIDPRLRKRGKLQINEKA